MCKGGRALEGGRCWLDYGQRKYRSVPSICQRSELFTVFGCRKVTDCLHIFDLLRWIAQVIDVMVHLIKVMRYKDLLSKEQQFSATDK